MEMAEGVQPDLAENVDPTTVAGIANISERISYYLNLQLAAKAHGVEVRVPAALQQIVTLAANLPAPEGSSWAALAVGKLPVKAKSKKPAGGENGDSGSKVRGKWDDDSKAELVRLVDDEDFREEVLGKEGTRQGHVNWAALARRYGFSGNQPIHRQYKLMTGKEPPGVAAKREAGEGEGPAAKKPKKDGDGAGPSGASAEGVVSADGWTKVESDKLVKLVEDEGYRKLETGKRHLKWSRVAEVLGKGKKECKKKYVALTGKEIDD